jgi:hypothetical protein
MIKLMIIFSLGSTDLAPQFPRFLAPNLAMNVSKEDFRTPQFHIHLQYQHPYHGYLY